MESIESFGTLLSDTVSGEKLSASKVERVRDSTVKQFHRGPKVCSVIVKVHRKASQRTRLPSLYLFDAVCRHAADIVRKRGSGFDYEGAEPPSSSKAERGTKKALVESAASFLRLANEILEEMVVTTMQAVKEEQKAKVIKVVDIWIKAGTFDEDRLMRVKGKVMIASNSSATTQGSRSTDREEDQDGPTSIPSPYGMLMDEEKANGTPTLISSTSRNDTPPQIPSSLLALLSGNNKNVVAEAKQNGSEEQKEQLASLDEVQLAMLQKIAQNSSEAPIVPQRQTQLPQQTQQNAPQQLKRSPLPLQSVVNPVATSSTTAAIPTLPASGLTDAAAADDNHSSFVPDESIGDLSQFNMMTFDPTSPKHWVTMAQHFHNTYQYTPSNQELMFLIMSAMQSQLYAASFDGSTMW